MAEKLVTGKIFLCSVCGESVIVEYADGPRMTNIDQRHLTLLENSSLTYGQPNQKPDVHGCYLFENGYCSRCFSRITSASNYSMMNEFWDKLHRMVEFRKETQAVIEDTFPAVIREFSSKVTKNDIQDILGINHEHTSNSLGKGSTDLNELGRSLIAQHHDLIQDYLIQFSWPGSVLDEILQSYFETADPIVQRMFWIISKYKIFMLKMTDAPDDLCCFDSEATGLCMRYPMKDTPSRVFFVPFDVDRDYISGQCVLDINKVYEINIVPIMHAMMKRLIAQAIGGEIYIEKLRADGKR